MDEDSDAFYADEDDEEDAESDVMLEGDDEDDEAGFDAAGDEAFSHDTSGKGKRKAHEVEFTCLDIAALQLQQKKEVDHVAGMFVVRVSRRRRGPIVCYGSRYPILFPPFASLRTPTQPSCCATLDGTRSDLLNATWMTLMPSR